MDKYFLNPMKKVVPGKFHGSGWNSKGNCLNDRANFYKSRAWKIGLIFITANVVWMSQLCDRTNAFLGTYRAQNDEQNAEKSHPSLVLVMVPGDIGEYADDAE